MYSESIEDYLRTIYELHCRDEKVTTTGLAQKLGVAPASVTGMLKRLADMGLVEHRPYRRVSLTRAGEKTALEVIRHHRLIESFLARVLGMPWDRVHEEAHRMEHVLSEDLEERIDVALDRPTTDPHGAPIPARDGTTPDTAGVRLLDLAGGQSATVTEVGDHDGDLLRYLGRVGLYPGSRVTVVSVEPFNGPLVLRIGPDEHTLSREAAGHVFVADVET